MNIKLPWKKSPPPAEPNSSPLDVAAIARDAAEQAAGRLSEGMQAEVSRAVTAEVNRAVVSALSPLMAPQPSLSTSPVGIYAFDQPIRYSTPQSPQRRPGSFVSVEMLRQLADNYDVLRSCIQHLKREVRAVPIEIVARDSKRAEALGDQIADATSFFSKAGGLGGFGRKRSHFEGAILEDLLVIGAAAIFFQPRRNGKPFAAYEVDAATIRPRTDAYGWPGPGNAQYEQWIQGVLIGGYSADQLEYSGLAENTRSYSPYYASSVEWLIHSVNAALRMDQWNLSFLTDGSTPSDIMALPEDWSPEQVKAFQSHWDAMLTGNTPGRQKTKFVPSGTQRVGTMGRKDQDFDVFESWLLRRTCSIYGVQPASIGYVGQQYKVSQGDSMESTSDFGAGVILDWRKEAFDDVLERLGYDELEVRNVSAREEDASQRATRNGALIGVPSKTINEGRQDEGLDPIEGGDQILVPNTYIPLATALKAQATAPAGTAKPNQDGDPTAVKTDPSESDPSDKADSDPSDPLDSQEHSQ